MSVKVKNTDFEFYPYVDTFCFLYKDDNKLSNKKNIDYEGKLYEMSSTGGSIDLINYVTCKYDGKQYLYKDVYNSSFGYYVPKKDAVRCDILDTWIHKDDVIYSEYFKSNISKDYSVMSKKYGVIPYAKAAKVYTGYDEDGDLESPDYYPQDKFGIDWVKYNYEYYAIDMCYKDANGNYIPKNIAIEIYYDINRKYKYRYVSKLDVYLFDMDVTGMEETCIRKEIYIEEYYEENKDFYYDDFIEKLDSLVDKDPVKVKEKKDEATKWHFQQFNNYDKYKRDYLIRKYGSKQKAKERYFELIDSLINGNKKDIDDLITSMAGQLLEDKKYGERMSHHFTKEMEKMNIQEENITFDVLKKMITLIIKPYLAYYIINELSNYWSNTLFREINSESYSGKIKDAFTSAFRESDFSYIVHVIISDNTEIKMLSSITIWE
jgi:hypothetical protein